MRPDFVPEPDLHETYHVDLSVSPEQAWEAMSRFDASHVTVVGWLWRLRSLFDKRPGYHDAVLTFEGLTAPETGFNLFDVRQGEAVTVAAIGTIWETVPEFVTIEEDDFGAFDEPGYAKIAWEVRIEPRAEGLARYVVELKVGTTDETSRRHFHRYWTLLKPFSHFVRKALLRGLAREAGFADTPDVDIDVPGDELLPARWQFTDTVTIDAPCEEVWPWLAQMGTGRGGWYSWTPAAMAHGRGAEVLHRDLQELAVGDTLPIRETDDAGFTVLACEPPGTLVLGAVLDTRARSFVPWGGELPERFWRVTWAFALEPAEGGGTSLLVRARTDFRPDWIQPFHALLAAPVHGFMERRQLAHIKERVEAPVDG